MGYVNFLEGIHHLFFLNTSCFMLWHLMLPSWELIYISTPGWDNGICECFSLECHWMWFSPVKCTSVKTAWIPKMNQNENDGSENGIHHLESRWRNCHVLVYYMAPYELPPFGSCAIYVHRSVMKTVSTSTRPLRINSLGFVTGKEEQPHRPLASSVRSPRRAPMASHHARVHGGG